MQTIKICIQDHCFALGELNALLESHFRVISRLCIVKKKETKRKALRADDMEAKKDGGTVDWEYLLSRVESF